jgi:hypothetical protein
MCPVKACISLIIRARSAIKNPSLLPNIPINIVFDHKRTKQLPSDLFLKTICHTAKDMGSDRLGFGPEEVGTHSNRSGGAMSMFLSSTPVYTIMLIGRWSSDTFMRYIRKQVIASSHGIFKKMLTYEELFTISDFVHNTADSDLCTHNPNNLASTISFNGSHDSMRRGVHPTFHLEH